MNCVQIMGRLCRDPETGTYGKGKDKGTYARYTLAVDRGFGDDDEADFIPCIVFGKGAEFAEKYFYQGMRVAVTGRLQSGKYETEKGDTRYTLDLFVRSQEFADSKKDDGKKRR